MRIAALLALILPGSAVAADVIAFGDSWGAAGPHLGATLADRGLTVHTVATGGSTAQSWADSDPGAIADALDDNPDARWVWVSLGGNDVLAAHRDGTEAGVEAALEQDLRTIIDATFARHPHVRLVMSGYDFPNFESSPECSGLGAVIFGSASTEDVNKGLVEGIGDVQAKVAADYPHVTSVDITGAMQRASGGTRDLSEPSPASLMADCIHPTRDGYLAVFAELDDQYWGTAKPVAAVSIDRTDWCEGEVLEATDISTYGDWRRWYADGAPAGMDASMSWTVSRGVGSSIVELEASNAVWDDDVEVSVLLHPAIEAKAGDDAAVCFGAGHILGEAPVSGLTYSWSPPAAVSDPAAAQPEAKPGVKATYTLTVTNEQGCEAIDEVVLTPVPNPQVTLAGHTWIAVGAEASLHWTVMPELVPSIDFAGGRVIAQTEEEAQVVWDEVGTYVVKLTAESQHGCVGEASLQVVVGEPGEEPTRPNEPDPGEETGCGCSSTSSGAVWWVVVLSGLAVARRRRS